MEAMEKPVSQSPQCPTPSTTFVQADPNSFRELVQRLTGASNGSRHTPTASPPSDANEGTPLPPSSQKISGGKRSTFKLYERRQYTRPKLQIMKPALSLRPSQLVRSPSMPSLQATEPFLIPPVTGFPASPAVVSPSTPGYVTSPLCTPSAKFSNLSILDGVNKDSLELDHEEEERAIKERRFYLHPSPRSRPVNAEPELLPLFPLTSPKTGQS